MIKLSKNGYLQRKKNQLPLKWKIFAQFSLIGNPPKTQKMELAKAKKIIEMAFRPNKVIPNWYMAK